MHIKHDEVPSQVPRCPAMYIAGVRLQDESLKHPRTIFFWQIGRGVDLSR